jgi:Family of unknown function (DUF6011)
VKTVATLFRECACGTDVALVPSQAGKLYPVDLGDEGIVTNRNGNKSAVVETTDFHRCASLPGLTQFVRQAIDRGARRLRMRLLTRADRPVALQWGDGKWRDLVFVSDGQPRDYSTNYGRLDLRDDGFRADDAVSGDVIELLAAVDDNPAKAAAAYGEATKTCCFCERDLDDERSITVGYGRNCAKRWGLEWGSEGENTKKRAKRTRRAVDLD